jgi:Ca2+-binding RTX toxin-like protein
LIDNITGAVTLPQSAERQETITITGNSTLNIGGLVTADKIDASGLTGNAALVMNGNSAIAISITGSGGDDRLFGSALRDTISGAGGNDNITGGTGTDTLTGGDGRDTFNQTALDSAVASTTNGAAGTAFTAAQTITFAPITGSAVPNVDIIGGFTAGDTGDILNLDSITAAVTGIGVLNNALVAGTNYFLSGNFTLGTGVFTITGNGLGSDTLIIQGFAGVGTNITTNTSSIVLLGVNSNNLVAGNIT